MNMSLPSSSSSQQHRPHPGRRHTQKSTHPAERPPEQTSSCRTEKFLQQMFHLVRLDITVGLLKDKKLIYGKKNWFYC